MNSFLGHRFRSRSMSTNGSRTSWLSKLHGKQTSGTASPQQSPGLSTPASGEISPLVGSAESGQRRYTSGVDMRHKRAQALARCRELRALQSEDDFRARADSSSNSDVTSRRGVFSRKHYGSVEMLNSKDDSDGMRGSIGRFRVETGELPGDESPIHSPVHLENPEYQTRWYFKYFLGKLHQNYVGSDVDKEPFVLSVVITDANNHNVQQYRAIMWRKQGNQKISLPYNPSKPLTIKIILGHFEIDKCDKGPKEILTPEIQKELLVLEEQEGSVNFKFGVIYAKDGQITDDDMYGNEHGSEYFEQFVNLLGDKIKLQGWDRYRAGLDTTTNTTGLESIYTVFAGHEIMFHVSTMLPHSIDNKQQVERKRHVGNDIVNIVFMETSDANSHFPIFKPKMMKTHFTHVYAHVVFDSSKNNYRVHVYSEESVPLFGPALPCPNVFDNAEEFRDFLIVKLINGEKAAFQTQVFAQKRERTLDMLIRNLYQEFIGDNGRTLLMSRRAFSDIKPDIMYGSRRKEEVRQMEFLRIGQALKVQTIMRGDAPTSLISSEILLKRQPWEPQCFFHDLDLDITCGDSWTDKLVVASTAGSFIIEEGVVPRLIFDKSIAVRQLAVAESHGLLLFLTDKGKDSRVYVFLLRDFEGEESEELCRNKLDIKDNKLERTKGCHLFTISKPNMCHLRLVYAIGRKVVILQWRYSSAWSAWCDIADRDLLDGFLLIKEIQAPDSPQLMTLLEGDFGEDERICIGYKNQFDIISEKGTVALHVIEASKVLLIDAVELFEDDEPELLLSYNHISHFQKISEEQNTDFDIHWNSEPKSIVCAFPYILAFTSDSIEIRLMINGNLVYTMTLPQAQLITAKSDLYFLSSTRDYCMSGKVQCRCEPEDDDWKNQCNGTPGDNVLTHSIYKIPFMCLSGGCRSNSRENSSRHQAAHHSMFNPLLNGGGQG